jgi:hypothetical protein
MRFLLPLVLILAGCASVPHVDIERGAGVDLSRYRTYAWREQPNTQSPLVRQRIVAAVDRALADKGWRMADDADVALAAHVTAREEETLETIYDSSQWNQWRWHDLPGVGDTRVVTLVVPYTIGTLIIDIFDVRTRQAVWRATAEGSVPPSPEKINVAIDRTVPRMFAGFPTVNTESVRAP